MTQPVASEKIMPPNPAPMLAIPNAEATAEPGRTSAGMANMLASDPV